jgi:hypothetical protein
VLRRKDYLLEGLTDDYVSPLDNIIRTLEGIRVEITKMESENAERERSSQVDATRLVHDMEANMELISKHLSQTINVIEEFISREDNDELRADVETVFRAGYQREGLIDALLDTLRKHYAEKVL